LHDELFGSIGIWHLHRCNNSDCGLGSLQPPPTSAEIIAAYECYHTHSPNHDAETAPPDGTPTALLGALWTGARERYQARRFGYAARPLPRFTSTVATILSWLIPLLPGHRADFEAAAFYLNAPQQLSGATDDNAQLLEVGCGGGRILERMQSFGWQVTGTDFDENAVAAARSRNLDVRLGTLAEQGFARASFDAIVLKHVIEHLPEPVAELALCNSLLKPGGKLIVLTPNLAGRGHARWQRHWRGLEPPRHLQIFTPQALATAITDSGFSLQELRTTGRTRNAFRESLDAQRLTAGKGNMTALASLALAELDEWLEAFLRLRDPLCGNELLAIATSSADSPPLTGPTTANARRPQQ
jgi:2-polyprenyl-3-methyl-5-hydroxy-6-metoxy-1,4-benzoquinol methylase